MGNLFVVLFYGFLFLIFDSYTANDVAIVKNKNLQHVIGKSEQKSSKDQSVVNKKPLQNQTSIQKLPENKSSKSNVSAVNNNMISVKDGFAQIVEKVIKSVVNISIKQRNADNQIVRDSLGSGVIIDANGYIITNSHVIDGDDEDQEISVVLHDGTDLKAKIIGRDSRADIALLKVETSNKLTPVKWGNSDKAKVGNWVIAIGNPEGFGNTVTCGIISCRARDLSSRIQEIGGGNDLVDYIQIDASINAGNSGGPIFNTSGEAIGIVSISITSTGSNVGLNFAMPSNSVKYAITQLRKYGKMHRGWIGAQMDDLDPDVASSLGLKNSNGSVVSRVITDSPAAKAGILQGDIIISVNGKEVSKNHLINRAIADLSAGQIVPIKIVRNGEELVIDVIVESQEDEGLDETKGHLSIKSTNGTYIKDFGIYVENINPRTANLLEIPKDVSGVVVVKVAESHSSSKGEVFDYKDIRVGDVITKINQTSIGNVNDFVNFIENVKNSDTVREKAIALLIYRSGISFYKAMNISAEHKK